jgi:hypothetical protein
MKRQWLDQLARDPAGFARIEIEIHDRFRQLADQMTASLLAEAPAPGEPPGSAKKRLCSGSRPGGPFDRRIVS